MMVGVGEMEHKDVAALEVSVHDGDLPSVEVAQGISDLGKWRGYIYRSYSYSTSV